jgi:Uma2 family endonuclease
VPTLTEVDFAPEPLEIYRMTVDEYERLAEAGVLNDPRVELIHGYLVRKMTKKPRHVVATEQLRRKLEALLRPGWHVRQEQPVRIPDFDEPEPDLVIAKGNLIDYRNRHPEPVDIALLVEVSEISLRRDKGEKLSAYSRGGVSVYWIVNLVDSCIEVYTDPESGPHGGVGGYRERADYRPGESVAVVIEGHEVGRIAVADLLP